MENTKAQDQNKKLTIKDHVRNAFVTAENRWMLSGEIQAYAQEVKLQSIYAVVSAMAQKNELERREVTDGGGFEYRLFESTYTNLISSSKEESIKPVEPAAVEPEPTKEEPVETKIFVPTPNDIMVIPEGVGAKRRNVYWDQGDRLQFCTNLIRIQREKPAIGFMSAAMLAQKEMPVAKQKANLNNRSQLAPWFDNVMNEARQLLEKQEKEQEEAERVRLLEEKRAQEEARLEAERQAAQHTNLIQGLTSEVLVGEIIRRGTSIMEAMMIQALQSPRVRDALANAVNDRRSEMRPQHAKHNPHAPSEDRPRLKKLLIFGLNKPVHQNEIIRDFKDMFDVRCLAAKPNVTTLRAQSRAADEVIVMSDSVDHGSVDSMKADSIEFTLVSGRIGSLREFLIKKFAEEEAKK